jgi:hypothetical protein
VLALDFIDETKFFGSDRFEQPTRSQCAFVTSQLHIGGLERIKLLWRGQIAVLQQFSAI